jgi:hypothetical protein
VKIFSIMNYGFDVDADEPMDPWVPMGTAGGVPQLQTQQVQQPPLDFAATMEAFQRRMMEMMEAQRQQTARDMRTLQTQFQTQISFLQQQQAAAIPAHASPAPAPPAPAPPQAAPAPIVIQQPPKSEYDRFVEEQVKKWQIPRFDGTMDLKLVTNFLEEVRNLGEVMELQPTLSGTDSNKLIVLAGPSQAVGPRDVSRMPILVIRVSRGSRLASHDSGATGASRCNTLASPVHRFSLVPQAGPFMSYP